MADDAVKNEATKTAQEQRLAEKIAKVEADIKAANEARKELDRQLKWLARNVPAINAEIIRQVESKDQGSRDWIADLRQQATDGLWAKSEAERKRAEDEAARKAAEAERIAKATGIAGPAQQVAKPGGAAA